MEFYYHTYNYTVAVWIGYSSVEHTITTKHVLPTHSTCIAAKEADDIASGFMDCNTLGWMIRTPA